MTTNTKPYRITSIKTQDGERRETYTEALERAREILAIYQPAYGVQVEDEDGTVLWSSEEACEEYTIATDAATQTIEAINEDAAARVFGRGERLFATSSDDLRQIVARKGGSGRLTVDGVDLWRVGA